MAAAAAASSSFAREGSWGSVSDKEGVRFRRIGGLDALPKQAGPLSAVANLDTMTWLDVVSSHLGHHPMDRDAVWYVHGGKIIGTDIPLSQPLRATLVLGQVVEIHIPKPMPGEGQPWDEHEKIKYAIAAKRCGRVWPAWSKEDTDPLNMAVLGGWDEKREGVGSVTAPPDQDNSIDNLVGLRTATGLVIYLNVHGAMKALDSALQALDPEVRPLEVNAFAEPLTRASLGSTSQRYHKLSPANFLLKLYNVLIDGFTMSSLEDRDIHATTHILPIVDVALLVALVEREMGSNALFTLQTPELPVLPDFFDECVDTKFGRALATVEIEGQNIEASPTGKRGLDRAEYEAALLNAESMLDDFLEEERQAIADGWSADEESWNEFLSSVRGLLSNKLHAEELVAHIVKRKKNQANRIHSNKKARPNIKGRLCIGSRRRRL